MIYPMLLLVIVAISGITDATRAEQAVQSAADRAAHTAALCCARMPAAVDMVQVSLETLELPETQAGAGCVNDVSEQAVVEFLDLGGAIVATHGGADDPDAVPSDPVPPGGWVRVAVACELPRSTLGAFGLQLFGVDRNAIGVATIDPFRSRFEAAPAPAADPDPDP